MPKILEKPIIVSLLLLAVSIYLYFFQLDKIALTDPDETFYAQTAKEMLNKGEWLTPILYGKPQFEKPILFYSLIEASYKIFGVNEFAARFPSAIFGLLGLIAAYFLGRLLFNNRAGLFSAIVLATNIEYIMLSTACVTDMVLSTCMLWGILFFFYGRIREKDFFYVLSAASFALATLTKGPIGILLPGFIIFTYLLIIKDFAVFKKFKVLFWSSVVFMLIALPWYITMYKLHAGTFIDEFFSFHNITRFLTPEHKTGSQVYYNIPIILGGFFPWSVFLPLGLWQFFKKVLYSNNEQRTTNDERRKERSHVIFILLWFFVIFIFFSISSTKLPTYVFPCFISLALIVGKLWDDFLKAEREKSLLKGMRFSHFLLLVIAALALVIGYFFLKEDYPDTLTAAFITAIFFVFGLAAASAAFMIRKYAAAFFLTALSVIITIYPMANLVLPHIEGYETEKLISEVILSMSGEDDIIGGERDFRAGLAFYTNRMPIHFVNNETLSQILSSGKKAWCVVKDRNVVGGSNIVYSFGEKRLLTNKEDAKK